MKKITKITSAAVLALMMILTNACKKEEMAPPQSSSSPNAQKVSPSPDHHDATRPAELSVRLFSINPGHYTALDFTILNVSVHLVKKSGLMPVNRWIDVPQNLRLINILKFQPLSADLLADLHLPDGIISEIRIDFAKRGIVSWNEHGADHTLKAPFSPSSVIIPTDIALRRGTIANIMLAFDVANTVNMEDGVNPVLLTPAIKVRNFVVGKTAESADPEIE